MKETIRRALLWIFMLAGLNVLSAAEAAEEQICQFRIRPQVERADTEREDGSVFIGSVGGQTRTAQLHIGTEGRSPEGNTRDLAELARTRGGRVLHAFWRLEARNTRTGKNRFLLWAEGNRKNLTEKAGEGWNLWDVTEWVKTVLTEDADFSFRLQVSDAASGDGGDFDLRRSWIYVTLALEQPDPELGENLMTDWDLLDEAMSALPDGHWALRRYQETGGSLTRARWPETGVPYYYGGHSEEKVLHRFFPLQESRYYKSDRLYLCGFDCGSFLHWVEEKAGYQPHADLSEILRERADQFPLSHLALSEWSQALVPGDLIVFNHGTYHAGMYLGTLRMFGLTEATAPEMRNRLDDPLMIHCGEDPFCHDRFRAYIEAQDYRMTTSPPDGGVTVSLLVQSMKDAPKTRKAPWGKEYGYFDLDDQQITVFPLEDCRALAWMRPVR